jgi:hypothetical protein
VFLLFEVRDDARAAGEDNEDMSTCRGSNVEEGGRTVKDNEGGSGRGRSRKSSTRVATWWCKSKERRGVDRCLHSALNVSTQFGNLMAAHRPVRRLADVADLSH